MVVVAVSTVVVSVSTVVIAVSTVVVSVSTVVIAVSTVVVSAPDSLWHTGEAARPPQSVSDHMKLSLLVITAQSS